jgi:hypothetical protein
MIKKLHIFDFDGTLFQSPLDTPENKKLYEKVKGTPWPHRGWWGRAETLQTPLVPDPAPKEWFIEETVKAFQASRKDHTVDTVIMTGRHKGLRNEVMRILMDGGLMSITKVTMPKGRVDYLQARFDDVRLFCLGERAPKAKGNCPNETFPWKLWTIKAILENLPEVEEVGIWEDRPEHVEKFKAAQEELGLPLIVTYVPSDR